MTFGPSNLIDRRKILEEYARLGLKPISGGSGEGDPADPKPDPKPEPDPKPKEGGFTQEDVNRLVGAAREEGKNAERARLQAEKDAEERTRQQEEEKKKGNYEAVIDSLTKERDDYKAKYEKANADLEKWTGKAKTEIDEKVAEIAKKNKDLAELDPGGDDLFKRSEWLTKAMKIVGDLTGDQSKGGNGPNPKATGTGNTPSLDEVRKQLAAARGIRTG